MKKWLEDASLTPAVVLVTPQQWGVPDRGVTIAILTLGKGRVPNHHKKILAGLAGLWGCPRA